MSEVPHCPSCNRADTVSVRAGPGYEYYCSTCNRIIKPDEITDGPFIDMVSERMFREYEQRKNNAVFEFNDNCECEYCERGCPGLEEIKQKFTAEN